MNKKPIEIPYQSAANFSNSIDGLVTSGAMTKPDVILALNAMDRLYQMQ